MESDLSTPKILKGGGLSAWLRHILKLFVTPPAPSPTPPAPIYILIIALVFLPGMLTSHMYAFWFQTKKLLGRSLVYRLLNAERKAYTIFCL